MKTVYTPPRRRKPVGPRPPASIRMLFRRTGTVVWHKGYLWEISVTGAADMWWRQWVRCTWLAPTGNKW